MSKDEEIEYTKRFYLVSGFEIIYIVCKPKDCYKDWNLKVDRKLVKFSAS